jgi:hypothetical protein
VVGALAREHKKSGGADDESASLDVGRVRGGVFMCFPFSACVREGVFMCFLISCVSDSLPRILSPNKV